MNKIKDEKGNNGPLVGKLCDHITDPIAISG